MTIEARRDCRRYCEIHGKEEVQVLEKGMDFRLPEYRREVFLRFFQFHLMYKAHPGGVYYVLPYLIKKYGLSKEQAYWLAFINGCSQNPVTTLFIFERCPQMPRTPKDIKELASWFHENYRKMGWDTDRRYVKTKFKLMLEDYNRNIPGKQADFFESLLCHDKDQLRNFRALWPYVLRHFDYFGRLSSFSYLEYLRIIGLNIECDRLFLEDIEGSKSHRNGLCRVLGRDDLEMHATLNPGFQGYSPEVIDWLTQEGELLLQEARTRFAIIPEVPYQDVNYFTLESTLCCYKSWHRINRRYPNVYNDMLYERLKEAVQRNPSFNTQAFYEARKLTLPMKLRLENCQNDPGFTSKKKNFYLETGRVPMMNGLWPCFQNELIDASPLTVY